MTRNLLSAIALCLPLAVMVGCGINDPGDPGDCNGADCSGTEECTDGDCVAPNDPVTVYDIQIEVNSPGGRIGELTIDYGAEDTVHGDTDWCIIQLSELDSVDVVYVERTEAGEENENFEAIELDVEIEEDDSTESGYIATLNDEPIEDAVIDVFVEDDGDTLVTVTGSVTWTPGQYGLVPDGDYEGSIEDYEVNTRWSQNQLYIDLNLGPEAIVTGNTFYVETDSITLNGTISEDLTEIWYHLVSYATGNELEDTLHLQ